MTPEARGAYKKLTRILQAKSYANEQMRDSASFTRMSADQQRSVEAMYWAVMDPIASTKENEFRTEYYARVAYADLLWSSDDFDNSRCR